MSASAGAGDTGPTAKIAFVDSHAHLADEAFDQDRDLVVARAREAGAVAIVCIGESLTAASRARVAAAAHPGLLTWTAGVHPHDATTFDAGRDLPAIAEHLAAGAVAVGECGLDYHYDHAPRHVQRAALLSQLSLAAELGFPVVVHTRDAETDTLAVMTDAASAGVSGVLHCFTGSPMLADAALACGWFISFSGIVTFKRWTDEELVRRIPRDKLLVESDSPYLAPVPFRGRRNEPAWVVATIARLAAALGEMPTTIASATTDNARRLFGLASPSVTT